MKYGFFLLITWICLFHSPAAWAQSALQWPEITSENRPWTRWWWMGSSVEKAGLSASLDMYRDVGLGGVEITPIYGVKGYEDQFVEYLSPAWVDRLVFTLEEASRLNMGVDMATGTGWPFGGPWVDDEHASRYLAHKTFTLGGGERLQEPVTFEQESILRTVRSRPTMSELKQPISANDDLQTLALDQVRFPVMIPLQVLMAYSDAGEIRDLTTSVNEAGELDWTAPEGTWRLYAVFNGQHGKMVERAAPGGEGYAIDHFSSDALQNYLAPFDEAFKGRDIEALRAFFNDSYEVDDARGEATWTPAFLDRFEEIAGYDLRTQLPALLGEDENEIARRVLTDYRHVVSELLLEQFTKPWTEWAHNKGAITRNQSHGSPANILDLYAASDIPEAEGGEILRFKQASSAAHVTGKLLASSESATWLNEHFRSNLADLKESVDKFLLGGINHVVYHGTAYSPADEPWPGWLFYAAVHAHPSNPLWTDFRTFNEYIARSQSILQGGSPGNDVLLYLPMADRYADRGPSMLFHVNELTPFEGMTFLDDAEWLLEEGYPFDFISDRQVQSSRPSGNRIQTQGGAAYETVVVPGAHLMPVHTLRVLLDLAEGGATVIFHRQLPVDVPGLGQLEERQEAFQELIQRLQASPSGVQGVALSVVGQGRVLLGNDLEQLLEYAGVHREEIVDAGLGFVRRIRPEGTDYFISNWSGADFDGWAPLNAAAQSVAIFNPMTGITGLAQTRSRSQGGVGVYLQLAQGESAIVRTFDGPVEGAAYVYRRAAGSMQPLEGVWRIRFEGERIPDVQTERLVSWTEFEDEALDAFSGMATYSITFPAPEGQADGWLLNLGEVHESARVRLNGQDLGTLIGPTYQLLVQADAFQESNELEIDVSNLMANRIAEMDRQQIPWKKFYNINFPSRLAENRTEDGLFDASHWDPLASGLVGPVTLTPQRLGAP